MRKYNQIESLKIITFSVCSRSKNIDKNNLLKKCTHEPNTLKPINRLSFLTHVFDMLGMRMGEQKVNGIGKGIEERKKLTVLLE